MSVKPPEVAPNLPSSDIRMVSVLTLRLQSFWPKRNVTRFSGKTRSLEMSHQGLLTISQLLSVMSLVTSVCWKNTMVIDFKSIF